MINQDLLQTHSPLLRLNTIKAKLRETIIIEIQSSCDQQIANYENSTSSLSSKNNKKLKHHINWPKENTKQHKMIQQSNNQSQNCLFAQRGPLYLHSKYEDSMQEQTVQSQNDCQGPNKIRETLKKVQNNTKERLETILQQQITSKIIGEYLLKIAKNIQQKNRLSKHSKLLPIQQSDSLNPAESQSKAQTVTQKQSVQQKRRKTRFKKQQSYLQLQSSSQQDLFVGFYRYKMPFVVDMIKKLSQKTKSNSMKVIPKKAMIPPRPPIQINSAKHRFFVKNLKLQLQSRRIICLD